MNRNTYFKKTMLINSIIAICTLLTIVAHGILPAKVDINRLDSIIVKEIGFPIVAILYFIILYTQCVLTIIAFKKNSTQKGLKSGMYIGIAFASIYLIGMQEIVLNVSPYDKWNIDFVIYQFFMGIGDGIPVFILCSFISKIVITSFTKKDLKRIKTGYVLTAFTVFIGTVRTIITMIGIIQNSFSEYPMEVIIWNYAFGCVIGICYIILYKIYNETKYIMLCGIVPNWIIFNMFIGLIKSGAMIDALLRSIIDSIAILIIVTIIDNGQKKDCLTIDSN